MPELIGLFWTTGTASTKEEGLILLLEMAEQENTNLIWEEVKTRTIAEYDAAYIEIVITEGDIEVPGVIVAFYDPYGRLMMPYHLGFTGSNLDNMGKLEKIIKTMKFDEPDELYVLESYWPTDGWRYASPAQVGMDISKLEQMVDAIEGSSYKVESAMVMRARP